jgi:hypothetical protein
VLSRLALRQTPTHIRKTPQITGKPGQISAVIVHKTSRIMTMQVTGGASTEEYSWACWEEYSRSTAGRPKAAAACGQCALCMCL